MLLLPKPQHDRPADDRFAKTARIEHCRVAGREKVVGPQVKQRDRAVLVVANLVGGCRPPARTPEALVGVKGGRALRNLKRRQRQLVEFLVGPLDNEVTRSLENETGLNGSVCVERRKEVVWKQQRDVGYGDRCVEGRALVESLDFKTRNRAEDPAVPRVVG